MTEPGSSNFVGTIDEVKAFLQAHKGSLFYIEINPTVTPDGSRQFSITTFPAKEGRRILNELHPEPGDPRMTPGAKKALQDAGQL
ncbi:MAG: hypothetical protein KJ064_22870 [Anaerolineae bacterium]|jgi:hypothetical protein|nr:MAG: hypothetical protein F9K27_14660 [Anaerolineae bacterium]MCL4879518.1 hypothetical protein [Anaerolineae bacterium]